MPGPRTGPGWHDPRHMRSFLRAAVLVAALALTVTTVNAAAGPGAESAWAGTAAGAGPIAASGSDIGCPPTCRVLIISIPAVSWADVNTLRLPHLKGLFEQSAIADLATRSVRQRTSPGDGYAALGAGARAVAAGDPGQNFEPDEPYGDSTAAEVFHRRTGLELGDNIGALSISSTVDANDQLPYDAEAGTLGATLTEHGFGRAVVANADEDELEPADTRYHREAALSMMDTTGRVPAGRVGNDLTQRDPDAPFGLRLNRDAVMRAFTKAWEARPKNVVLVEASDVARANAYRGFAAAEQRAAMRKRALHTTDKLVGRLLRHVDPAHDAVLVVGPYHSSLRREVTIAVAASPGRRRRLPRDGDDSAHRLRADRGRRADGAPARRHRPAQGDGGAAVRRRAEQRRVRAASEAVDQGEPCGSVPRHDDRQGDRGARGADAGPLRIRPLHLPTPARGRDPGPRSGHAGPARLPGRDVRRRAPPLVRAEREPLLGLPAWPSRSRTG